ncbi:MAG: Ldh family oxidoreductase [Alphaproteobacteria bacterium]|nr:Ldh family oxidoreductase [Alphaproteobacteria bacterium]
MHDQAPVRTQAAAICVPADALRRQIVAILRGWGVSAAHADAAAELLVYADLRGISSHGLAMMANYAAHRPQGSFTLAPEIVTVRETPALALLDGGAGMGHLPGIKGMDLAIAKCAQIGIGAVSVRNSWHFGAAGYYAEMAVARGFIGIVTTSVWNNAVVPTHAAEPMLGTNPIAFAAPARRNPPFVFDMATSTVAAGKIQLAAIVGKDIPVGWSLDAEGKPETNAQRAWDKRFLTPLGGTPDMSSHKGYGLGAMVEILSGTLSGARHAAVEKRAGRDIRPFNVGHFFLALDPAAMRGDDGFRDQLDALIDALRTARPVDPRQPVLIAGDPERARHAERVRDGVPIPQALAQRIRAMAAEAGVDYGLEG